MTNPTRTPITSIASLRAHWSRLLGGSTQHGRSIWIMAHDADGHPLEHIVVVDDLPLRPEPADIDSLAGVVAHLTDVAPDADHVVVLLSRPGTERTAAFEEDWARALTDAVGSAMIWPVCCASPHGVRVLADA